MIQLKNLNSGSLLTTTEQTGFTIGIEYSLIRQSLDSHEIFEKTLVIELIYKLFESRFCILIEKLQFGFTVEDTEKKFSAWKAFCNGKIATIIIYEGVSSLKQIC